MKPVKRIPFLFVIALCACIASVVHLDRRFFKAAGSFSPRFFYSCLPINPNWNVPTPSIEEQAQFDHILSQKFHYLGKGAHCFAFVSEDGQHVIKFHRYASHMRIFPWLTHPFSYAFNERRKQIKKHNIEQLDYNLRSYLESWTQLKEECGLLWLHINPCPGFDRFVTVVDTSGTEHTIDLNQTTFILQKKAKLIYPTLDSLYQAGNLAAANQVISQIISLISTCCQKGYIDQDPLLYKNYGLLEDRAIHIDVGDLVREPSVKAPLSQLAHLNEMTLSLKKRLEKHYPALLPYYLQEMERQATSISLSAAHP